MTNTTNVTTSEWDELWRRNRPPDPWQEKNGTAYDRWEDEEECRRYDERAKKDDWAHGKEIIGRLPLEPGMRILDIGAGPGTLAIPLAEQGYSVTALDASEYMLRLLRKNADEKRLDSITAIRGNWATVDLSAELKYAPYDVILASYSIFGMVELSQALRKMDEAATKGVYVYWFADPSPLERAMMEIWPSLHGEPYKKRGKAEIIFNCLYSMGIVPNFEVYDEESSFRYAGADEATEAQAKSFNATTPRQKEILRGYFDTHLFREDTSLTLRGYSKRARISWKPRGKEGNT
jgi:ubiquinone/menaquinone biosynthesis C-methylase UbiE